MMQQHWTVPILLGLHKQVGLLGCAVAKVNAALVVASAKKVILLGCMSARAA